MLIYLKPLSIFPELHSDTLFGALTYAINELYPNKIEDMILHFNNNEPPFILSSAFPFLYNDVESKDFSSIKKIKFYPKIIFPQSNNDETYDQKDFKEYKKVKFLEDKIFFDLLNGKITENDILNNFSNYNKIKGLLMSQNYDFDFAYDKNIIPNNSINRLSNQTEGIFYTEGNEFKNIGLFFLIDFYDETYIKIIKSAIKFLKDRGFGKDISVGKGQFDYYINDEYSVESEYVINNPKFFVSLSRFIPSNNDLNIIDSTSSYEIGSKRGKSSSNDIRKQIKFFKEGSVFPYSKEIYGRIVKSGNKTPAVENGFAYLLKCVELNGGK